MSAVYSFIVSLFTTSWTKYVLSGVVLGWLTMIPIGGMWSRASCAIKVRIVRRQERKLCDAKLKQCEKCPRRRWFGDDESGDEELSPFNKFWVGDVADPEFDTDVEGDDCEPIDLEDTVELDPVPAVADAEG